MSNKEEAAAAAGAAAVAAVEAQETKKGRKKPTPLDRFRKRASSGKIVLYRDAAPQGHRGKCQLGYAGLYIAEGFNEETVIQRVGGGSYTARWTDPETLETIDVPIGPLAGKPLPLPNQEEDPTRENGTMVDVWDPELGEYVRAPAGTTLPMGKGTAYGAEQLDNIQTLLQAQLEQSRLDRESAERQRHTDEIAAMRKELDEAKNAKPIESTVKELLGILTAALTPILTAKIAADKDRDTREHELAQERLEVEKTKAAAAVEAADARELVTHTHAMELIKASQAGKDPAAQIGGLIEVFGQLAPFLNSGGERSFMGELNDTLRTAGAEYRKAREADAAAVAAAPTSPAGKRRQAERLRDATPIQPDPAAGASLPEINAALEHLRRAFENGAEPGPAASWLVANVPSVVIQLEAYGTAQGLVKALHDLEKQHPDLVKITGAFCDVAETDDGAAFVDAVLARLHA